MGYSLGFWLDHNKEKGEIKVPKNCVELHINYWSIESKEKFHYLDIGVKLTLNNDNLESINFFFPFDLEIKDYMNNLGETICSRDELLELIFNEKLRSTTEGPNYKDVIFEGDQKDSLRIYKELDIVNGEDTVELISNNDGTTRIVFSKKLIKSFDDGLSNKHHYFRFRLRLNPENVKKLSQNYDPQDRLVLSRFEKTEIIDFRLNELRDLPGSVCNILNNDYTLKQIHFFLIRDIHDELKLAHADYKRCRLLEKEVWKEYLIFSKKDLLLPSQMLIYHFCEGKKKEGVYLHIERFNAFAKFARVKVTIRSLVVFIFSVVLLGAIGSIVATIFIENRPPNIYSFLRTPISHHVILVIFIMCLVGFVVYLFNKNYTVQSPIKEK
ncbi:hypothetical protein ABH305_11675 [Acinetobacter pittii]|uniref:hypothetical protein n=1 Tax=Acinetobacter pittii TaxID=48296 RepID=UPI003261A03F